MQAPITEAGVFCEETSGRWIPDAEQPDWNVQAPEGTKVAILAIPPHENARHDRLAVPNVALDQTAGTEQYLRPGERRNIGNSAPIRVVLIDDHPVVLAGLQKYLELAGDIIVSGTATDGAEALALIAGLHPDVLVLDVVLRDISGLLVAHDVRRLHPEVAVLMLTADEELSDREGLLRIGVHGCLSKAQPGHQIAAAVRVAANGGTLLHSLVGHLTPGLPW